MAGLETYTIRLVGEGVVTLQRQLEGVSKSARNAGTSTGFLRNAITGLVSGAAILGIIKMADTMTNLRGRLGAVLPSAEAVSGSLARLGAIAKLTGGDMETTVNLFTRLKQATAEMKLSVGQLEGIILTIQQAAVVSGASAQEASNAIRQLTQGLASGALRGDEFRSVAEQLPVVLKLVKDSLGLTLGELREYSIQGKLTAKVITEAFQKAAADVNSQFNKMPMTIARAFNALKISFMEAVDLMLNGTGVMTYLADSIKFVSDNIFFFTAALFALGAAFAALKLYQILAELAMGFFNMAKGIVIAIVRMTLFIATHALLIAGIVAATAAIAALVYAYLVLTKGVDAANATVFQMKDTIINLGDTIKTEAIAKIEELNETIEKSLKGDAGFQAWNKELKDIQNTLGGVGEAAANVKLVKPNFGSNADDLKKTMTEGGKAAGAEMKNGVMQGGKAAGSTMADIMNAQAAKTTAAAATIFEASGIKLSKAAADILTRAGKDVANIMSRAITGALMTTKAEINKLNAEKEKLRAETAAIRAQTNGTYGGGRGGGGSGGGSGSFGSGSGGSSLGGSLRLPGSPISPSTNGGGSGSEANTSTKTSTKTEQGANVDIKVVNVWDPENMVNAIGTQQGSQALINFAKANREQLIAILGV